MVASDEPSGITPVDVSMTEMVDNLGESLRSTKSSKGRKLRQVLQKKQLDVLLQTYSSYIDEPVEDQKTKEANDFYTISRKQSIEAPVSDRVRQTKSTSDLLLGEDIRVLKQTSTIDDIRRMRRNKSLISDDEEKKANVRKMALPASNKASDEFGAKTNNDLAKDGRKGKKRSTITKRKKREDLTARINKATDIVHTFTNRCGQKHLEIAKDFTEASKELRHHLKSGANIAFEDLADHFDGVVENLFVAENEQRDDDGGRQRRRNQQSCVRVNWPQRQSSRDPSFQPLSHDEALLKMNKQVSQLLKPVSVLTDKVYDISCRPSGGVNFEVELGRIVRLPST